MNIHNARFYVNAGLIMVNGTRDKVFAYSLLKLNYHSSVFRYISLYQEHDDLWETKHISNIWTE